MYTRLQHIFVSYYFTLTGDGTEQTRGFYTYYLLSNQHHAEILTNTEHHHGNRQYSALNRNKPLQTGLRNITNTQTNEVYKNISSSHNHSRKKRVERSTHTKTGESNDLKKRKQLNSYPEITATSNGTEGVSNEALSTMDNDPHVLNTLLGEEQRNINSTTNADATDHGTQVNVQNDHIHSTDYSSRNILAADDIQNDNTSTTIKYNDQRYISTNKHDRTDTFPNGKKKSTITLNNGKPADAKKRQKRFLQFFRSDSDSGDNFIFRALNFLVKNRKNVVPIISVVRDINTLVKSANGELNHVTREQNNYVGIVPPVTAPVTYSLELGHESTAMGFVKRLFGLSPKGDRLTIGSGK